MSVTAEELDNLEVGDKVYIRMYSEVKDLITTERDLYKCFYGKPLTVMERGTDDRIAVFDETDHTGIVFPVAVVDTIVKRVKEPSKVHHPNHYNQNGMEVWDVIKAFTSNLSGAEAFYAGNAIKYILRWDKKNGIEDLEKAKVYIDKIIEGRKDENGKFS